MGSLTSGSTSLAQVFHYQMLSWSPVLGVEDWENKRITGFQTTSVYYQCLHLWAYFYWHEGCVWFNKSQNPCLVIKKGAAEILRENKISHRFWDYLSSCRIRALPAWRSSVAVDLWSFKWKISEDTFSGTVFSLPVLDFGWNELSLISVPLNAFRLKATRILPETQQHWCWRKAELPEQCLRAGEVALQPLCCQSGSWIFLSSSKSLTCKQLFPTFPYSVFILGISNSSCLVFFIPFSVKALWMFCLG